MPGLTSLKINLNKEEQVDYIIKNLPDLEHLNGLEVDRDMEEEEEEEEPDGFADHQVQDQVKSSPAPLQEQDYDSVNHLHPGPSSQTSAPVQAPAQPFKSTVQGVKNKELERATLLHDQIQSIYRDEHLEQSKENPQDFVFYIN